MDDAKTEERRLLLIQERDNVRAKLMATGATVLSPTAEWSALRKRVLELNKQLK